jgi:hypothetical protein
MRTARPSGDFIPPVPEPPESGECHQAGVTEGKEEEGKGEDTTVSHRSCSLILQDSNSDRVGGVLKKDCVRSTM